jgi:hypothetical protein
MSGNNPYAINDLDNLESYLQKYTEEECLFHAEVNEEVKTILNLKAEDLKSLSPADLYVASCLVTTYVTYLGSRLGHHEAIFKWCKDTIKRVVAKNAEQYDKFMKYEQKVELIILADDFATKVDHARRYAEYKVGMIKDKVEDLRTYSDRLERLGRIRSYESSR